MHNISPARAMARQARRYYISGMIVSLVGLVLAAIGIAIIIIPLTRAGWYSFLQTSLVIGGLIVGLVGLAMVIRGLTFSEDNADARHMANVLATSLDYRYTFIRHISRRELGYIDAVLVGPNGALVFYFFTRKGRYYTEGNVWFRRQSPHDLHPARVNPTVEVVKDVNLLRTHLANRGLPQVPVYAAVVVSRRETLVEQQKPVVPVAPMPEVLQYLQDNYLAAERIDAQLVKSTIRAIME